MRATREGIQWLHARAKDLSQSSVEETLLAAIVSRRAVGPDELEALLYPVSASQAMNALDKLVEAGFVV